MNEEGEQATVTMDEVLSEEVRPVLHPYPPPPQRGRGIKGWRGLGRDLLCGEGITPLHVIPHTTPHTTLSSI